MEKKTTKYTALAVLLALSSCAKEGPLGAISEDDGLIRFRTYLPSVAETRAGIISKENLMECRVTSFNPAVYNQETGEVDPYFHDKTFERHADGHFLAEDANATRWPNSRNTLHFFAYYPSAESMKASFEGEKTNVDGETDDVDDEMFNLVNNTKIEDESLELDYMLEGFRIAEDIAEQVDFIAAYTSASQPKGGVGTLPLNFSHQLARIDVSAWSKSEKYGFEIAGVRIGNAIVEGDFNFASLASSADDSFGWLNTEGPTRPVEHIFAAGESIVVLKSQSASSSDDAVSIMGNAGPAMVIPMPAKVDAWEGKADPKINDKDYSTDKLYLSVLLRVINKDNEVAYPYPNNCDLIPVTYLVVDGEGKVVRRVFKKDNDYYTAKECTEENKYIPGEEEEIKDFSWAALPVTGGAKWEAGKIYSYKLNYTKGIGWQDPEDPTPGEPIIERGMVPFEVSVAEWEEAEGYEPDLNVPRR